MSQGGVIRDGALRERREVDGSWDEGESCKANWHSVLPTNQGLDEGRGSIGYLSHSSARKICKIQVQGISCFSICAAFLDSISHLNALLS